MQIRACAWQKTDFGLLQPINNQPISDPTDDTQWLEIIGQLDQVIASLNRSKFADYFKEGRRKGF